MNMESLARTKAVLAALRDSNKERCAADDSAVKVLSAGQQLPVVPFAINSFAATAMLQPYKRDYSSRATTDLPPASYLHSDETSCVLFSIPYPHVAPMEHLPPSSRVCQMAHDRLLGDSMSLTTHIATNPGYWASENVSQGLCMRINSSCSCWC